MNTKQLEFISAQTWMSRFKPSVGIDGYAVIIEHGEELFNTSSYVEAIGWATIRELQIIGNTATLEIEA
jgi:hypothetical protein